MYFNQCANFIPVLRFSEYNTRMKEIKATKKNKTRFAYARVSTDKQLLDRQIDMLAKYDIPTSHYFTDIMSGTKKHRPGFDALMKRLEEGDELYIESFSRLSRSTKDLLNIVEELDKRGITIHSLHENFDTATATGKLMLTMISALSQFERDILSERTREGLRSARARGHNGGRPAVSSKKIEAAMKLYNDGSMSVLDICKQLNISKSSFYKYRNKCIAEERRK